MIEPVWVPEEVVIAYHQRQLAEHGGGDGIRDLGLLRSALARPMNAFHYERVVSPARLAACYAYSIAKNHAFVDGNKRTALVVSVTFLRANGYRLTSSQEENYLQFYRLAAGELSESALAEWLESKLEKLS